MKDKKRVLKILAVLIIAIAAILFIVLVFGGIKAYQINKYKTTLEEATCKMAEEEHYTAALCEAFDSLCKVHFDLLIANDYINQDLKNPLSKIKASDDKKAYIKVSFKDSKMICTYKEG